MRARAHRSSAVDARGAVWLEKVGRDRACRCSDFMAGSDLRKGMFRTVTPWVRWSMPESTGPLQPVTARADHVFPTLNPAQIARIAAHGGVRAIRPGEVLVEAGEHVVPFFVVTK